MHLVEVGKRTILLGEITNRRDWRDVPVHGVDAFESDDLGRALRNFSKFCFEVSNVVVTKNVLLALPVADTLDNGRVVLLV